MLASNALPHLQCHSSTTSSDLLRCARFHSSVAIHWYCNTESDDEPLMTPAIHHHHIRKGTPPISRNNQTQLRQRSCSATYSITPSMFLSKTLDLSRRFSDTETPSIVSTSTRHFTRLQFSCSQDEYSQSHPVLQKRLFYERQPSSRMGFRASMLAPIV